jgi:hypothetical protein
MRAACVRTVDDGRRVRHRLRLKHQADQRRDIVVVGAVLDQVADVGVLGGRGAALAGGVDVQRAHRPGRGGARGREGARALPAAVAAVVRRWIPPPLRAASCSSRLYKVIDVDGASICLSTDEMGLQLFCTGQDLNANHSQIILVMCIY